MMLCSCSCLKETNGKKTGFNSDKGRQGLYTYLCVCRGVEIAQALESFSFFLSVSIFLSPSAAPFINQPFIKQKQLPALPKRCIDNLDMKTEYLPSLPSISAPYSAW